MLLYGIHHGPHLLHKLGLSFLLSQIPLIDENLVGFPGHPGCVIKRSQPHPGQQFVAGKAPGIHARRARQNAPAVVENVIEEVSGRLSGLTLELKVLGTNHGIPHQENRDFNSTVVDTGGARQMQSIVAALTSKWRIVQNEEKFHFHLH
jgi:hypothetical protein